MGGSQWDASFCSSQSAVEAVGATLPCPKHMGMSPQVTPDGRLVRDPSLTCQEKQKNSWSESFLPIEWKTLSLVLYYCRETSCFIIEMWQLK